ncbi:hypothetical protein Trydic_g13755 [Trypoxylus dichotomus]
MWITLKKFCTRLSTDIPTISNPLRIGFIRLYKCCYYVQPLQSLLGHFDYVQHLQFCWRMLQKHVKDLDFYNKIIWSDEGTFKKYDSMNMHNFRFYAAGNQHLVLEERSHTGLINGKIIGSFVLPQNLNGEHNHIYFGNELQSLLENLHLVIRKVQLSWSHFVGYASLQI